MARTTTARVENATLGGQFGRAPTAAHAGYVQELLEVVRGEPFPRAQQREGAS
jgi:hypothetical protein